MFELLSKLTFIAQEIEQNREVILGEVRKFLDRQTEIRILAQENNYLLRELINNQQTILEQEHDRRNCNDDIDNVIGIGATYFKRNGSGD